MSCPAMAYSLQSCTPKYPSLPLCYHVNPSLAMCCSWARVLQALGTLPQPGGARGRTWREGGSWFWGSSDGAVCPRPTDQSFLSF